MSAAPRCLSPSDVRWTGRIKHFFNLALWLILLCGALHPGDAQARTWKDKSGKFSVEADYVDTKEGQVVLKKGDGSVISVALDRLSDADRAFVASQGETPAAAAPVEYVAFPKAGIKLTQPEDFIEVENFEGFYQEDTEASVVVLTIPDPYAEAIVGFNAEKMLAGGMTLRSKDDVKIDGRMGALLSVSQKSGETTYAKWVLVFGGPEKTHIVTAMCPVVHEAKLSKTLKAVIFTAKVVD